MSCRGSDSEQWDNCVGLARFENGNIYRGEFRHGLREGLGFLIVNGTGASDYNNIRSNDGPAIYAGEFRGGHLNGHGVWFTKSGAGYSGKFIDNNAQSDVSHTNCSGELSPSWSNCVARFSYENGNTYYGEFMQGRREGIGMLEIHETGISDETNIRAPAAGVYVGEFRADRLNGHGMIFMPGAGFYGIFTNNILNASPPGVVAAMAQTGDIAGTEAKAIKHYKSADFGFQLDIPSSWRVVPHAYNCCKGEMVRFSSTNSSHDYTLYIARFPHDPMQGPQAEAERVQQNLIKEELYSNLVTGQTTLGSEQVVTLDFDSLNGSRDGNSHHVRDYFMISGTLLYVLVFSTDRMTDVVPDQVAGSFVAMSND